MARYGGLRKASAPREQFIRIGKPLFDSAAYRILSAQERAVLVEVFGLYNGRNNGSLALSSREAAARANVSKDTAARALNRLEEVGLIETMQEGRFDERYRRATEYRRTDQDCDVTGEVASHRYLRWGPQPVDQS